MAKMQHAIENNYRLPKLKVRPDDAIPLQYDVVCMYIILITEFHRVT